MDADLIKTMLKMSRVSRKFYYITINDGVWKNVCCDLLGHAFVELNETNQEQYQQKQIVAQNNQKQSKAITSNKSTTNTIISSQVQLKQQNLKETHKTNHLESNNHNTFWKQLAQYFYKEFQNFTITLQNYRNQNCPLQILQHARFDMIKGLKLVNEIFSLVALNKHKQFILYKQLMILLKDNFTKGVYCLSRLAQMDEENIRYDAFDTLFSFLSLEKSELPRFRVFQSISTFLNKGQFTEENKLKALLSTEIAEMQGVQRYTYDKASLFFTSLLYNQRVYNPSSDNNLNYDLNNNQTDIKFINSFINSSLSQDFFGHICKRESNQIIELKGQITFKGDMFEGFGITSHSTNFKINGKIKLQHNQYLKKTYEVYNTVPYFGKGFISTTLNESQTEVIKKYALYATFTYALTDSYDDSLFDSNQYLTFYGTSENLREIIVIKL